MASEDLVYKVGVDASDAVSGLRKLEGAVRSTMREVGDELDDSATAGDKFAASIDRLSEQMRGDFASAAVAAEELQRALRAAGSSLEVGDAVAELKRMGVSFDEITADADKFATSLKQLDDVRLEGVRDLDSVAPGLATKLDDVNKSADSSRSALANMVGNSAQDLGEMAGVAGSAGVAVGQMAEYFADAVSAGEGMGSALKSMAGVAVPIAGLALATKVLGDVMTRFGDSSKRTAANVAAWEDALSSGDDASEEYADSLRDLGKVVLDVTRQQSTLMNVTGELSSHWYTTGAGVEFLSKMLGASGEETKDLTATLTQAGVDVDRWTQLIQAGGAETAAFVEYLKTTNLTADEQADILAGLAQQQTDHAKAAENDAKATAFFGEEAEDAGVSAEELAQKQADAVKAARDHEVAMTNAAGALAEVGAAMDEIRADAISGVFDEFGKPEADAGKIRDIAGAIAGLPKALEDLDGANLGDVLAGSFKADSFLDTIDGIAGQMRERMAAEFASGNAQGAKDIAESTIRDIVASLGGKLTGEQVSTLLGLDDLEAQIDVALNESKIEAVRRQLAILTGVSGESPLTASIALALEAGTITPEAAEILVQAQLGQAGVKIPSTLDTPNTQEAMAEAGRFVADGIDIPTTADTTGAVRDVDEVRSDIEGEAPAEVPVAADVGDAEDDVQGFRRTAEGTTPIVPVDSDTKRAIATMIYLKVLATLLAPTVNVTADVSSAVASLNWLQRQTPRVGAEVYVADYPSSSEIQRMIGRPRIPVDIVVGSTVRITGVRE